MNMIEVLKNSIFDAETSLLEFLASNSFKILAFLAFLISLISGSIIILNQLKQRINLKLVKNIYTTFQPVKKNSKGYTLQSSVKFALYNNSSKSFTGDIIKLFFKEPKIFGEYFQVAERDLNIIDKDGGKMNISFDVALNKDIKNKIFKKI